MSEARPAIPESIRRQVRKECYFGCVLCGCPIFDYDHMIDYAQLPEHRVDNLVLLCRSHHIDKTGDRLSLERVRYARANPVNKLKSLTSAHKLEGNKEIELLLGSNRSVVNLSSERDSHYALWVNGVGYLMLHFEDGWLTFSMRSTDAQGNVLLIVDRGQLSVATNAWDYRYEGTKLKIWEGKRKVLFEADISNYRVHVTKGTFIDCHQDGFIVDGDVMTAVAGGTAKSWYHACVSEDCETGSWAFARMNLLPEGIPRGFGIVRAIGELKFSD